MESTRKQIRASPERPWCPMDEKKNKENYYGYKSHINDDQREKLITAEQKASNTEKSRIRSRDEIIFSAQSSHGSTLRSNNRNDESGLHI